MGRLFDNPAMLIIILIVILLLFGAPKLPGMARSLGQSMRIFKSEVTEMRSDEKKSDQGSTTVSGEVVSPPEQQTPSTEQNRQQGPTAS